MMKVEPPSVGGLNGTDSDYLTTRSTPNGQWMLLFLWVSKCVYMYLRSGSSISKPSIVFSYLERVNLGVSSRATRLGLTL